MNYLIVNPIAGRGRCRENLDKIKQFYQQQKEPFEMALTEDEGHAVELARDAAKNGATTVVSVGGDGTFLEVLNGAYDKDVTLGVIPAGTGNDFARSIGFSHEIDEALQQIKNSSEKYYDIGKDKDGVFGCICGQGFTVDVMDYMNNHRNSWLRGQLAFAAAVYNTVRKLEPDKLTITVDDKTFETEAILTSVLNTPFTGGGMKLTPNADPTDGLLDLIIVGPVRKVELLTIFPRVYKGTHVDHPAVSIIRGKKIEVHSEEPMLKMFDGTILGTTPIQAEVMPKQIKVISPGDMG